MKTSKPCATMSWSNSPFLLPDQPISGTVRTSWPANSRPRRRGTHSSRRMRMSHQHLLRQFQRRHSLLAAHGRKVFEELAQRFAGLQVVEQAADRNARAHKDGRAPEDVRI